MPGRWAAVLALLTLVGCGPLGPTPTATVLAHATGERDVLLRMSVGGGLPYPGLTIEQPPEFTLYGNGHLVRVVQHSSSDGTYSTELRHGQADAAAVDALLRMALNEGGLATAADFYENDQIYDAGTTTFTINAGGVLKTVHVYALGFMDDLTPNSRERAGFRALVERIDATGTGATDLGTFVPTAYLVSLVEPYAAQPANALWPWPELVPADFHLGDSGIRTRIVTASQGEAVLNLGITHDLVARAPDGQLYLIRIRVLLPDEIH